MENTKQSLNKIESPQAVYGPVKSWRFGWSLGIDPIFEISTCSFNCIYCQLGNIQRVTLQRKVYIPTEKIIADFNDLVKQKTHFDVITFSGSGEPTLAENLGEIGRELKKIKPNIPLLVLTNSTNLALPEVQADLQIMDRVIVKLDAADNQTLQMMNRPAEGVTLERIVEGIQSFRKVYKGELDIQMMFMPANINKVDELAEILNQIKPDTVQLNTPLRPYPLEWNRDSRGNHNPEPNYATRTLRVITKEEAKYAENRLRELTKLNILSVYRE